MSVIKKLWDGLDLLLNRKSRLYTVMRDGEILHMQQKFEGTTFDIECHYTEQSREYALPFGINQWRYTFEIKVVVNEACPQAIAPYLVRRKSHIVHRKKRLANTQLRQMAKESILIYFQAIFDHRKQHKWSKFQHQN